MNNTQKKIIMLTVLLAGCALTSVLSIFMGDKEQDAQGLLPQFAQRAQQQQQTEQTIRIYVSGAVLEPGLYDLPQGSRAEAAILAAGGMTEAADATRVNLARKLKDGNQVNVPTLKQSRGSFSQQGAAKSSAQAGARTKGKNNDAAVTTPAGAKKSSTKFAVGAKVRINSASARELESLPGIGPALAQRIVDARQQARFSSVEDLRRVPGIGKAKLERLRAHVDVD